MMHHGEKARSQIIFIKVTTFHEVTISRAPPYTYLSQEFTLQVIGQHCLSFLLANALLFNILFLKAMTEETELPVSPVLKMSG